MCFHVVHTPFPVLVTAYMKKKQEFKYCFFAVVDSCGRHRPGIWPLVEVEPGLCFQLGGFGIRAVPEEAEVGFPG